MDSEVSERFTTIQLPETSPFLDYELEPAGELSGLSTLNIFIGANNSGKSRFLRGLASLRTFQYSTNLISGQLIHGVLSDIKSDFDALFPEGIDTVGNVSKHMLEALESSHTYLLDPEKSPILAFESLATTLDNLDVTRLTGTSIPAIQLHSRATHLIEARTNAAKRIADRIRASLKSFASRPPFKWTERIYIPMLRGLRPPITADKDVYKERTLKDYFATTPKDTAPSVHTGLDLYSTLRSRLLGMPEGRDQVRRFEEFLSAHFFEGLQTTLIPYEKHDVIHIKIGEQEQRPVYELGDGMQSLVILTFNVFLKTEPCAFFLEEPEVSLHPGFQRTLLTSFFKHPQHQYFVTTHSNHLLDMTTDFKDVSVYHFARQDGVRNSRAFKIRLVENRDRRVLLSLGVRNSSVFLSNSTIWVEGITDRLYLRAYMRRFVDDLRHIQPSEAERLSRYIEDYHYSFVEYGGANLVHWSFDMDEPSGRRISASFLCSHALLIADNDIVNKGDRQVTYERMMGNRFVLLEVKEIENLIPVEVLREVVRGQFTDSGSDVAQLQYSDYSNSSTRLAEYLDAKYGKRAFANEDGTLKSKTKFCDKVLAQIDDSKLTWQLPASIARVCERVFEHITNANRAFSE